MKKTWKRIEMLDVCSRLGKVARKVIKVYLTPEQKKPLERICRSLGMGESEVLRYAFMEYAKNISLITEKVHGKIYRALFYVTLDDLFILTILSPLFSEVVPSILFYYFNIRLHLSRLERAQNLIIDR